MPRPSISDLYRNFEAALAAADAIPPIPAGQPTKPFDRAIAKCSAIADKIVQKPARTVAEMLLKIRVVGWCAGIPGALSNDWQADTRDTEEFHALASIRGDLRRLVREGNIGFDTPFDE